MAHLKGADGSLVFQDSPCGPSTQPLQPAATNASTAFGSTGSAPDSATVTLVNTNQIEPREVVVQSGGYGEHRFESVTIAGKRTEIKGPITDQNRIIRQPGAIKRPAITEQPIIRGHVVGVALDEPDAAVAGVDQMRSHVIGGLRVVHEHG